MRKLRIPVLCLALAVGAACTNGGGTSASPSASGHTATGSQAASASPPNAGGYPVTVRDDQGVAVTLVRPPTRIVTFAPANTEIVFALGMGQDLVGVSGPYDDYPPAARKIEEVGGQSVEPNLEKVVSLHPDVLLATAGGDDWKDRLRQLGVPVFTLDAATLPDVMKDIGEVGRLLGPEAGARAQALTSSMSARAAEIQARIAKEPPVSCFYEVYYGPPLSTAGPGSFVYDLLKRARCDPVTAEAKSAYPTWSVEELVREDPRVYLIDSLSAPSMRAVAKRPGFGALSAVRHNGLVIVDSDLVTRPGPRVVQGLQALAEALHPEAFAGGA